MDRTVAPPRLVTAPFVLVTAAAFAYFTAIGATLPTLPAYVDEELGGGGLAVGVAVGAFSVSAALLRSSLGRLGDRRGRRLLVVGGAAIVGVSIAGYHLAPNLGVLVGWRLLTGVGEAAVFIGAATAVQDLAPSARRGEAASYFSIAIYGGLAIGPPAGEALQRLGGFSAVWWAAAGACLVAAVLGWWTPVGVGPATARADGAAPDTVRPAIFHRDALGPGMVLGLAMFGFAGFAAFLPLHVDAAGLDDSGGVFLAYGATVLIIRILGARLPDRLGAVPSSTAALAAIAAGMVVLAAFTTPAGVYAGAVVFAVGMALLYPALFTLVMAAVDDRERSHAVGTFTLFFDLAQGAGALLLGGVVALTDERGAFLGAAVCAGAGLVLLRRISMGDAPRSTSALPPPRPLRRSG
ncbi:MFS transporter [soil metagenome]